MDTHLILENISKHISLTQAEEDYFISLLQVERYKSMQYLLKEGGICKNISFINKGYCRSFTIDRNGFEHILYFASPDWWIGDLHGFVSQKPGIFNIQAMEETEILYISKSDLEILYQKVPKFERFFRILAENSSVNTQQRVIEGLSLNAEERYAIFCEKYTNLLDILPQKQIALYIGVTPEFFSRMKKRIKKK
jgi:CRP-like cAMP-binding protein